MTVSRELSRTCSVILGYPTAFALGTQNWSKLGFVKDGPSDNVWGGAIWGGETVYAVAKPQPNVAVPCAVVAAKIISWH